MEKNKEKRKQIPLYSGVIKYFPDALCEVARVSYIGSKQHHPEKELHWDREKSSDDLDALMRHLLEAGTYDDDGILHDSKIVWRSLANLQKVLEKKKKDDKWVVDQYNRNRLPHDQIISGTE
jgi:hypothetical protein